MTETEQNALTDEYAALLVAIQGIHAKIEAALLSRSATPPDGFRSSAPSTTACSTQPNTSRPTCRPGWGEKHNQGETGQSPGIFMLRICPAP